MVELIIGMLAAAGWFGIAYLGFREGVRIGMKAAQGVPPAPVQNPVTVIKQHKQAEKDKKEADRFVEGFNNIMGYNGSIPKKGGDE